MNGSFFSSFKKYYAIARINCATKIAYPFDQISGVMYMAFFVSILFFFHSNVYRYASADMVEGLMLVQVIWMLFIVNIFSSERTKGVSHLINEDILSGDIAYQLSKPYSYIIFHFSRYIGEKVPTVLISGTLGGILVYSLVGSLPQLHCISFLIGIYMISVGLIINFLLQFCIGMVAFWIENVEALRWMYRQTQSFAGGAIIPIAYFPIAFKKVFLMLPFSHIVYSAVRVMMGCRNELVIFYLGMQLLWLILLVLFARMLFQKGVKNVVISGG